MVFFLIYVGHMKGQHYSLPRPIDWKVVHVLAGTHSRTKNEMSMASDVFALVSTEIVVVHVFVASVDNLFLLLILAKRKEKYSSRYILSLVDCLYRTSPSVRLWMQL